MNDFDKILVEGAVFKKKTEKKPAEENETAEEKA